MFRRHAAHNRFCPSFADASCPPRLTSTRPSSNSRIGCLNHLGPPELPSTRELLYLLIDLIPTCTYCRTTQ
ncbi:cmgc cdk cdk9 protein kinase [Moniliophthora roreri]|nr:cmgc cdk cdk9 protein kinase [Moniliophthora roreri]